MNLSFTLEITLKELCHPSGKLVSAGVVLLKMNSWKHVFLGMMWRRMNWLRQVFQASEGRGGTWSHERHPYPDSYVLAFLPQLLIAG